MTAYAPINPDFEALVRASFARQTMMESAGARMVSVIPGFVELRAPILPTMRQQHDFGHGGLSFSLGDVAAGYSALTLQPPAHDVLTIEMKINFLAPAQGEELIARGRVIRPGRRMVVVGAEVAAVDEDGKETPVALLQGTMIPASL